MAAWSTKDKAAIEAAELDPMNLGADANVQQFLREDYTGPSWNVFVSAWKWMRGKLGRSH
jgi:hypothetical protein